MIKWEDILKVQETLTDVGFDYDLPEEVEPKDNKCCEKMRPALLGFASAFLKKYVREMWKEADCETLRKYAEETEEWRHAKMHINPSLKMAGDVCHSYMKTWRECENE